MTPSFSTKRFAYDANSKMFLAEISQLEYSKEGYVNQVFGQVYQDSCDEGLILVSHKTGLQVRYAVSHIESSEPPRAPARGDIQWWDLTPIRGQAKAAKDTSIRIYND